MSYQVTEEETIILRCYLFRNGTRLLLYVCCAIEVSFCVHTKQRILYER